MNVASLELCRELYELSGWREYHTAYWSGEKLVLHGEGAPIEWEWKPAYDLGYLLRKLPPEIPSKVDNTLTLLSATDGWWDCYYEYSHTEHIEETYAAKELTPEDAACKLAIELFKQGVLTRGGDAIHPDNRKEQE